MGIISKYFSIIFFVSIFFLNVAFSNNKDEVDIKKLSEAIGNIIGKNLDDLGFKLDLKKMILGMKKGHLKKSAPMNEDECLEALAQIQISINEKIASKNLNMAENFLINNLKDKDVIELEKQKLYYKVLKKGKKGQVEVYHTPIVKITGRYLDGTIFTTMEETINLSETLPSLKKSILGMHLNEKRQIFIHPSLAFKDTPPHLNSLVIFDVEIIDLDAKKNPLDELAHQNKVF